MGREHADPIGLAVTKAAQEASPHATVILFGSRARGDHRPDSDVDLLVIVDEGVSAVRSHGYGAASNAAFRKIRECPGKFGVDVIPITRESFGHCRRARNHIAAQALRDGVIMNDDELDALVEFVTLPPERLERLRDHEARDWLTQYAVDNRADLSKIVGAEHRLDPAGYRELQERISRAVTAFVEETFRITGTGAGDLESGR